jgi:hypothetical protein
MIMITATITNAGYIVSLDNVKASVMLLEEGLDDASIVGAVVCEGFGVGVVVGVVGFGV